MRKISILAFGLTLWTASLQAQITQKQADTIAQNYLQNKMIDYGLLYVYTHLPNEEGITITTSNEEIFTAKYACWAYYADENGASQRHYLFVKEDDGNLLEAIASNDVSSNSELWKPMEAAGVFEMTKSNIKIYPNPTTGQLTIDNGELTMDNVKIYDIIGKVIDNYQLSIVNSQLIIDVSHLPAGMYFLKINNEILKIIKN